MDPGLEALHGPHPLKGNGTLSLPRALSRKLGMEEGKDSAYWILNPALPGSLILVPSTLLNAALPEILAALAQIKPKEG